MLTKGDLESFTENIPYSVRAIHSWLNAILERGIRDALGTEGAIVQQEACEWVHAEDAEDEFLSFEWIVTELGFKPSTIQRLKRVIPRPRGSGVPLIGIVSVAEHGPLLTGIPGPARTGGGRGNKPPLAHLALGSVQKHA